MNEPAAPERVDMVITCLRRDLPKLALAYQNLHRFLPIKQLHVITARRRRMREASVADGAGETR